MVATPTPDTPLPCEDFGDRLGFRRSALVQVDMRGTTVPGFFAQDEGVTWLVLQVSSGLVGDDANCRICFTPADALRKAPAPIDWAIRAPIPVGTGPLAWLVDATALQPKLAEFQVHPIPLVDGTGQWRRHVAGDALLAMWIEPVAPDALIHHAVLRAEALEAVSGRVRLRFTSPLPASAASAPMLDRGGFLIGLVEAPSAGQAITARCIGPDELRGAMQQMPLVWANPEGLQALVAQARSMGFTRLAARHVRQMRSGAWKGLYDAPAAPCQTAFLGYVGEDAGEALRMSATRGFSCSTIFAPPFDPAKSASPPFALPPEGVWLSIEQPVVADGAQLEVHAQGGDLGARLLEIHALPETPDTANLPPIEGLIGLRRAATRPWTPPPSRTITTTEPTSIDPPARPDPLERLGPETTPDYRPYNPDGPIIRIPLHGAVGYCGDPKETYFTGGDFRLAMRVAAQSRPSVIVLDIKSPGGRVDSMHEMIEEVVLAQRFGQRVVAEVHDAGSAAALLTMACAEILSYPTARVGGASAWRVNKVGIPESLKKWWQEHPDPELEAKFESYEAAIHRGAAQVAGHSEHIAPAMRHKDKELWWIAAERAFTPTSTRATGERCVDGKDTELNFTCQELVEFGLAKECLEPELVPQLLGLPGRQVVEQRDAIERTPRLIAELIQDAGGDANAVRDEITRLLEQP